jgi:hypothetical protein
MGRQSDSNHDRTMVTESQPIYKYLPSSAPHIPQRLADAGRAVIFYDKRAFAL